MCGVVGLGVVRRGEVAVAVVSVVEGVGQRVVIEAEVAGVAVSVGVVIPVAMGVGVPVGGGGVDVAWVVGMVVTKVERGLGCGAEVGAGRALEAGGEDRGRLVAEVKVSVVTGEEAWEARELAVRLGVTDDVTGG